MASIRKGSWLRTTTMRVGALATGNSFPVLDNLVIGGRVADDIATWVAVMEHVRAIGKSNLEALRAIRNHLRSEGLLERSLVRILDSLLWTCVHGSALYGELADWERVFRPRPAAGPA